MREVRLAQGGTYCFIELWSDELASTALLLTGMDFLGRPMRIGRPSGFSATATAAPPLDVSPLKPMMPPPQMLAGAGAGPQHGGSGANTMMMSPQQGGGGGLSMLSHPARTDPSTKKNRELYVGNLPVRFRCR